MQDKTPPSHNSLSHMPPQGYFDEQEAMAKLVPIADELVALVQKVRAPQCLHQIQEPAAAEQAAWHAGLDEGRAQEAPAAVAVPTQALTGEARAEKIRGLAPIRAKLSAAADVAVPDGWHAPGLGEVHNEDHTQMIYCADGDGVASDDLARKVRAALAATPAPDAQVPQGSYVSTSGELKPDVSVYSTPAAVPVVLPEPDAVISELMGLVDEWGMESHLRGAAELDAQHSEATQEEIDCAKDRASKERAAWKAIESKLRALLAQAATAAAPSHPAEGVPAVEQGEVLVTVSGFTGSGKSAIAGEIEILCRALGLQVEWPDGDSEKNMTHADWTEALELYKPRVRIVECSVPHPFVKGQDK
ncbi:hypothetical protein [Comamonas testosteroni]|uniref:hypothetical protein n=1 Tax=Comamonas testosteroni TaxID=285 RepID=UPI0006906D29|nr:hypothetical protein [Comamonas testosteroni]